MSVRTPGCEAWQGRVVLSVPDSNYVFYFCRRIAVVAGKPFEQLPLFTSAAKPAITSHSAPSVRSFSTLAGKSFKAGFRRVSDELCAPAIDANKPQRFLKAKAALGLKGGYDGYGSL